MKPVSAFFVMFLLEAAWRPLAAAPCACSGTSAGCCAKGCKRCECSTRPSAQTDHDTQRAGKPVSYLIKALKSQDAAVRRDAAEALGVRLPDREPAIPALIEAAKDSDAEVREAAALAIGMIGRRPKQSVPALMAALKDPDAKVRAVAANALGWFEHAARAAVPLLLEGLKDPDAKVREYAAYSIREVGGAG